MEKQRKGEMRKDRKASHICLLLLALLQISTPASPFGFLTRPANVTAAVEKPAVFRCGVPKDSRNVTFNFYGNQANYSLTCPNGLVENITRALYGSCEVKTDELVAVWTLKRTSYSDNGTKVVCRQPNDPDQPAAYLRVSDGSISHAILIGCTIGGFFGILLVFGLSYLVLRRSQTLQQCFRGKQTEEDLDTIVTEQ